MFGPWRLLLGRKVRRVAILAIALAALMLASRGASLASHVASHAPTAHPCAACDALAAPVDVAPPPPLAVAPAPEEGPVPLPAAPIVGDGVLAPSESRGPPRAA